MNRFILPLAALILPLLPLTAQTHSADTVAVAKESRVILTLDSCLSLARQNNKELQRAALDVNKAQQVKNQALTKYFPQVKASAIGYHSLHPIAEVTIDDLGNASVRDLLTTLYGNYGAALGLDNTISLFQYGYQVGVTALQPVYMGGKIVAGNQLATLGVEAAQLQNDITERDLLEQVEESYWLVVGLTEKQNTLRAVTALLDTVHRTVEVAVKAGLALQTDLLQVELRQSEIHRTQIQLNNGLSLAKRALWQSIAPAHSTTEQGQWNDLCVSSLTTEQGQWNKDLYVSSDVADENISVFAPSSFNTKCGPLSDSEAVCTPESRLLSLQVRAAELQRRMTIADALPQVAVGAHYGYSNLQANFLRDGLGSKTGNGAVFVSVSVPLTAWWETGHKIQESNIAVEQARLQQAQMNEMLTLRTQQAYDKTLEAYLLIGENQHAVDIARENYRLSGVNYRAGMGTIADLLTAQTTLLQAENNLTDAIIAYRVNLRRYRDLND